MSQKLLPSILVIEDDSILLDTYVSELEETSEFIIDAAQDIIEAQEKLACNVYDVILTDLKLQAAYEGGLTILHNVKSTQPDTQVIIFTGIGGTDDARQAHRLKADGYMSKPLDFDNVRQVIRNAVIIRQQRVEMRAKLSGKRPIKNKELAFPTPDKFIYACQPMSNLVNHAMRLAATNENLFIIGEVGTGKGLIAEGIHFASGRSNFELVNCGSLSERSLERIIFGWFDEVTEAYNQGILERLSGGTLVLDRISGLGVRLQKKLLNTLKSGKYQVHPSVPEFPINLRIISLEETDLTIEVKQGLFIGELRQLLAQSELRVPPVRERKDTKYKDVMLLADHYISKYFLSSETNAINPTLAPETEYILGVYPFPGNVSELERAIKLALDRASDKVIHPQHLPIRMQRYGVKPGLRQLDHDLKVLCPHGSFYCNQTHVIVNAHQAMQGVYAHLPKVDGLYEMVEGLIKRHGMGFFLPEKVNNARVTLCSTCVPIQSSHYAILDISDANYQTMYEIGMIHALGIPTLFLKNSGSRVPVLEGATAIVEYQNYNDLCSHIENWLREMITT